MSNEARFEVFHAKGWFWRLRAANGEIVAQSETYSSKASAKRGVTDAVYAVAGATRQAIDPADIDLVEINP